MLQRRLNKMSESYPQILLNSFLLFLLILILISIILRLLLPLSQRLIGYEVEMHTRELPSQILLVN